MSTLQTLGDRWVFDLIAMIILGCLTWHVRILRGWSRRLDRQTTAAERMLEEIKRREAAVREQEGDLW